MSPSTRRFLVAVVLGAAALSPCGASGVEVAVVARINGAPMVTRAGTTEALRRGDTVQEGDIVETDGRSKIKLLLADDSVLNIGPESRLAIDECQIQAESRRARLRVLAGRFQLAIAKFFGGASDYEVQTPTAVVGVRSTVLWGDTELDAVCALEGTIEVRASKGTGTALVSAGNCVREMAAGKTEPFSPAASDLAAYLKAVTLD